jgi:hypothetical protein
VGSEPGSSRFHLFSPFHHFTAEPQRLPIKKMFNCLEPSLFLQLYRLVVEEMVCGGYCQMNAFTFYSYKQGDKVSLWKMPQNVTKQLFCQNEYVTCSPEKE